jgi:hypothetical protein
MKIFTIAILFIAFPIAANADQLIQMPGGGTCWQNDVGVVFGCSGMQSNAANGVVQSNAANSMHHPTRNSAALKQCLRTADWPGQPGKADCERMYGN